MMSYQISRWLVEFASRRWDDHEEMAREWRAELHELAVRGRHGEMLRFAFSLAVSRPFLDRRIRTTAAALLLAPVAAMGLWILSFGASVIFSEDILVYFIGEWAFWVSETARYVMMLLLAVLLALLAHHLARHSPLRSPLALAVVVVIPTLPVLVAAASMGNMWRLDRALPELVIWPVGFALALWAAGSARRRRTAWAIGLAGAFLAAQLATMSVMTHVTTPVDWGSSPMWLLSYFNYRGQMVNDVVSPMPEFYLMMTPYALSYVLAGSSGPLAIHK